MKTILYKIKLSLLLLLTVVPLQAFASGKEDNDTYKEKSISKVYLVNPNAGIDIRNKYGNVYVTTWDESKIGIDIVIKVHGKNENAVTKTINSINIEINPLTSLVSAKTIMDDISGSRNINIEINYTVKIPKGSGSIKLNNQYGSIMVDKIQGKTDIDCKYGNIVLGELLSNDNNVKIQYCNNSSIGYIRNGIIDAQYSDLKINKSGNLNYKSDYTNLQLKEVANITYNSNYGGLNIGSANNIEGNGDYLTLRFGSINNNFSVNTEYSSIIITNVTAKANNVEIVSEYTNIELKYDSDYSFNFEFNFKYANLNASGLNFQTKKEANNTSYYKGYYKSNGSNLMSVSSNYGNLKLTKI